MGRISSELESVLLTRPEAAQRYRVGVRTIDRWLQAGVLPKIQIGPRCIRLPRHQCDAAVMRFLIPEVTK